MTTSVHSQREAGDKAFFLEVSTAMATRVASKASRLFSDTRLSITLQGALAIAVGIALLRWPGVSLSVMVVVFAGYAVADGLLSLLGSFVDRDVADFLQGALSLGVAAIALMWRDLSAVALIYVMGMWVIAMAGFRVRHALESRKGVLAKALLVLLALPALAGGITALIAPIAGLNSVLTDIAIFQIINGVGMVGLGMRAAHSKPAALAS
jgi:uncharacterized membrane protein HdeD (DUF308 family)